MNWLDRVLEAERLKKAEKIAREGRDIGFTGWLKLPIKERIKKVLDGSLKVRK